MLLLVVATGAFVALRGGAEPAPWYPPCAFQRLTGLHCPGCGSARAIHAALHGEWLRALHNNALLVLAAPFLAWWLTAAAWRALRHNLPPRTIVRPVALPVLVVILTFAVLRNVPFAPGPWLAPLPLERDRPPSGSPPRSPTP